MTLMSVVIHLSQPIPIWDGVLKGL